MVHPSTPAAMQTTDAGARSTVTAELAFRAVRSSDRRPLSSSLGGFTEKRSGRMTLDEARTAGVKHDGRAGNTKRASGPPFLQTGRLAASTSHGVDVKRRQ